MVIIVENTKKVLYTCQISSQSDERCQKWGEVDPPPYPPPPPPPPPFIPSCNFKLGSYGFSASYSCPEPTRTAFAFVEAGNSKMVRAQTETVCCYGNASVLIRVLEQQIAIFSTTARWLRW